MAVCVCNADGALNDTEQNSYRSSPALSSTRMGPIIANGSIIALQPVSQSLPPVMMPTGRGNSTDHLERRHPEWRAGTQRKLGHDAILPLQWRMVYRIGNRYGYELTAATSRISWGPWASV